MKKFVNMIGNILLTLLVILLVGYSYAFIEMKILLKPYPELFGYVFYIQPDDKMMNEFYENDVVIIKKGADYRAGEIIFYMGDNNKYYIRRVTSVGEDFTKTKCDMCINKDKQIDNQKIKGKAIGKILFLGQVIYILKNKIVLTILATVGFTCLIVSQYMVYKPKDVKKKIEKVKI